LIERLQRRVELGEGAFLTGPQRSATKDAGCEPAISRLIDPDNTLHIVDRAKDVIKSGGEWISSQALEEAAMRHPAVREAAVVAMQHPRWQERPLLIAVLTGSATATADDLRSHLLRFVPKWWLPDAIAFATELPHGPTGKLQKDELRRRVAEGMIVPVTASTTPGC